MPPDAPHRDAREDQQANQQTHRCVGIPRPVQRKHVIEHHQYRRVQQTAHHRPQNQAPPLHRRQARSHALEVRVAATMPSSPILPLRAVTTRRSPQTHVHASGENLQRG